MTLTPFHLLPTIIEKNWAELIGALDEVKPRWMEIGLYLGFKYHQLESIAIKSKHHPVSSMVADWLKWSHNYTVFGKPSWKKLVEAIGAKAGGNNSNHAQSIAKQHRECQFVRPVGSSFS